MAREVTICTPPRRRLSRRGLLTRYRRTKVVEPTADPAVTASPPVKGCCFLRKRKVNRTTVKSVRFANKPTPEVHEASSTEPSVTNLSTPRVMRKRSLSSKGLKLKKSCSSIRRSTSRRSFYSAVSSDSKWDTSLVSTEISSGEQGGASPVLTCICKSLYHTAFDKSMPLVTAPGVIPGSYDELLCHAESILGNWVTLLDRSDTLDPQMVYVGIGKMKRMVMNRLAIPFTAVLEANQSLLHCWISTPAGAKHTRSSLVGRETEDKDSDLGDWTAHTSIVDYSIKWFCGGKTVRAMQMKRLNPKLGTAFETRVALPDPAEGKILLYNITIIPPPEAKKETIHVDRIYKFVSS